MYDVQQRRTMYDVRNGYFSSIWIKRCTTYDVRNVF